MWAMKMGKLKLFWRLLDRVRNHLAIGLLEVERNWQVRTKLMKDCLLCFISRMRTLGTMIICQLAT